MPFLDRIASHTMQLLLCYTLHFYAIIVVSLGRPTGEYSFIGPCACFFWQRSLGGGDCYT